MRGKHWSRRASSCEQRSFGQRRKRISTSNKWADEGSTMPTTTLFSSFPKLSRTLICWFFHQVRTILVHERASLNFIIWWFSCVQFRERLGCGSHPPYAYVSTPWSHSITVNRRYGIPFREHGSQRARAFREELYRLYFGSDSVGLPKYIGCKAAAGNILNYSCICRDNNWPERALKLECFPVQWTRAASVMDWPEWNITRGTRRKLVIGGGMLHNEWN